jgi:hypothetical protein
LAKGVADVFLPKEAVTHVEAGSQGVVVPGLKNGGDGGQSVGGVVLAAQSEGLVGVYAGAALDVGRVATQAAGG